MKRRKTFHPHFRKSRRTHHYGYVYEEKGDRYSFIGITHSPETHGMKNVPLQDNPNPEDRSKSYAYPKVDSDQKNLSGKDAGWKLSRANRLILDGIISKKKTK